MRREWIEISRLIGVGGSVEGLPPCGGSGLKFLFLVCCIPLRTSPSMRREWIEIFLGSGLFPNLWSPSMRREWIEINCFSAAISAPQPVSLHAEGVD